MKRLTFDASARKFVLDAFDKGVDKDGFIVEKSSPSQRILTAEGEEIKVDELAAIRKGSEVFIKSDLISLIGLSDTMQQ